MPGSIWSDFHDMLNRAEEGTPSLREQDIAVPEFLRQGYKYRRFPMSPAVPMPALPPWPFDPRNPPPWYTPVRPPMSQDAMQNPLEIFLSLLASVK